MTRSPGGAALIALGTLPFVAGVASNAAGLGAEGAPRLICPFAASTGLPCPFCGASRAFRHAVAGDPAFLQFNPVWVFAAALLVVVGTGLVVRARRRGDQATAAGPMPLRAAVGLPLAVVVALLAGGWCVALVNRDAIIV